MFKVDDPGAGASTFLSPSSMLTPSAASAAAAVSAPKSQPNYNVSTNVGKHTIIAWRNIENYQNIEMQPYLLTLFDVNNDLLWKKIVHSVAVYKTFWLICFYR